MLNRRQLLGTLIAIAPGIPRTKSAESFRLDTSELHPITPNDAIAAMEAYLGMLKSGELKEPILLLTYGTVGFRIEPAAVA